MNLQFNKKIFVMNSINKTILLLAMSISILSCGKQETVEEEDEATVSSVITISDEEMKKNNIEAGVLPKIAISQSIKTTGVIEIPSTSRANVYSLTKGNIRQIYVLPGEKVKKGQRLASLYDMEIIQLQEDYLKAISRMEYLEPEWKRKKELASSDAVSKKELEKSQSEYKSEVSNISGLENKLRLIGISPDYIKKNGILSEISIISPINGFVAEGYVSIGDAVHESKLLFEIIDNSYMHIVLRVPVSKIGYVKEGQDCVFGLNTGQESMKGKVHLIGKKANSENGTVEVHVDPLVNDPNLVVGSNVFARIFTGIDTVTAILTSELIRKGDDFFLYKENGKNWVLHKINTGISNDEFTEITNEELKNVRVILKGNYFLSNE